MRRRDFVKVIAGSVIGWPLPARAQQLSGPVIGFSAPTYLMNLAQLLLHSEKVWSRQAFSRARTS